MESPQPLHWVSLPATSVCKLLSWSVHPGEKVRRGRALCSYTTEVVGGEETGGGGGGDEERLQLKSSVVGVVKELMVAAGDRVHPGCVVRQSSANGVHAKAITPVHCVCTTTQLCTVTS